MTDEPDTATGGAAIRAGRRSRRARQWLVAVLVTLIFTSVIARETSAAEIVARLRAMPATALLWAVAWLALAGATRAVRLQLLVGRRLGFTDAYAFNQIYNVVSATVPTGLGEAASAWVMRRALKVPLHLGLVALFAGRFLDLVVLLCLFLGVVLGGTAPVASGDGIVAAASGLCVALLAVAVLHVASRGRLAPSLHAWAAARRSRHGAWGIVGTGTALLAESLSLLPEGRKAAGVVVLTVATQLLSLAALHALLAGAQVALGYASAIVCFVIYILLRMLPLQGIAGIGTTAAWWAIALSMLGVEPTEAAAVGSVLYVAFYALLLALCLMCLPMLAFARRKA